MAGRSPQPAGRRPESGALSVWAGGESGARNPTTAGSGWISSPARSRRSASARPRTGGPERRPRPAGRRGRAGRGPDRTRPSGRRRLRGIVVFLLLTSVVSGVTYQAYRLTAQRPPKVQPGLAVTFTVDPGEGSRAIGAALERDGVVDSAGRFRAVAEERGLDAALKPGTYRLQTGMNVDAVIDILVRGPNLGPPFTVPEGFTVAQIVDRLVATRRFPKAEVVKALSSPELKVPFRPKGVKILEGLLFPQTYPINKDDTPVTVLQQML